MSCRSSILCVAQQARRPDVEGEQQLLNPRSDSGHRRSQPDALISAPVAYRCDLDFNLPGDWHFRIGLFDNYDSQPASGFSKNDYGWSTAFGLKF